MGGVKRVGDKLFYYIDSRKRLVIFGRGRIPSYAPREPQKIKLRDSDFLQRDPYSHYPPWSRDYFTAVKICQGVTSIGAYAFASQTALHEVILSKSVESIKEGAFKECSLIEKFVLPNDEIDLHPTAFIGVPLTSLVYERGKDGGFYLGQAGLYHLGRKELVLGANVDLAVLHADGVDIHPFAFAYRNQLKRVICHSMLERIGVSAFEGCENLEEICSLPPKCVLGRSALEGTSGVKVYWGCKKEQEEGLPKVAICELGSGHLTNGQFVFYNTAAEDGLDPTPLYRHRDLIDIKAGKDFLVGLRENGLVICVEKNIYRDVFDGYRVPFRFAEHMGFGKCQSWKDVRQISAAGNLVAGLREDGMVYCTKADQGNVTMEMLQDIVYVEVDCNNVLRAVKKNGEIISIDYADVDCGRDIGSDS